ncbi:MAG: hypothetical protein U0Q11_16900 [Vicinamibacterales bacterium]
MLASFALPAAFLLSGAAGLIFQMVWFHRCALVFGGSVASATVVLSGFMGGLAAGNLLAARRSTRLKDAVRTYAMLEVVVALSGVLVTYLLPHVGAMLVPVAQRMGSASLAINFARFVLAFALLAVPATAMGATLPMLVAALCTPGESFGRVLGRLYGWNTIGAVIGVVTAEVVLIATVGVSGSAWVAACANLLAAAIAYASRASLIRDGGASDDTSERSSPLSRRADAVGRDSTASARSAHGNTVQSSGFVSALYLSTAVSGATLLALEVIWFRFLSMYVLVTTLAMSLMLGVVLAGIGLGGLAASQWLRTRSLGTNTLPVTACVCGVLVVAPYAAFQLLTSGTQAAEWYRVLWFATVLSFPVSFASGALFTLIGQAAHQRGDSVARSAGYLTLANTLGAIGGPAVAAYLLLPWLGMERSLVIAAVAYGAVAGLTAVAASRSGEARSSWQRPRLIAAAMLLCSLVLFPYGAMAHRYFPRAAAAYDADGSTIVATREGPAETLFVMQQQWLGQPVYSRLVTNGFSMSGTALLGQRYMRAFAYYPMLLHDGPLRRALVVCYGVGVTVGAVTHIPTVSTIDVAEISKDVVSMSDAIYPAEARPLQDPRVRLHVEDGRFFLQTTTERFDLITGEPPPPRTPGTVNIYTRDYFQLVHDRLAEGGLATYWVPVGRPNPGTDINTVIRAFCEVFSDCSLWNATPFDLMLVGSNGAHGPRSAEQFSQPWQTPGLEARLREAGFERPEQIGATFVGDAAYLNALTKETPPLTDDFPQRLRPVRGRPSLSDPRYGVDPAVTQMFQATLDPQRARAAFAASPFIRSLWPASLIERTLPYFDVQAIINRVYWEGGQPLRQIEDLDAVLSKTTLRTLPLWLLGSDDVKQRIAESSADRSGAVEYARGLRAVSGRDYASAARFFEVAASRGLASATLRPLYAYALLKSGRVDDVRTLLSTVHPAGDDERHFWTWMTASLSTINASPAPRPS